MDHAAGVGILEGPRDAQGRAQGARGGHGPRCGDELGEGGAVDERTGQEEAAVPGPAGVVDLDRMPALELERRIRVRVEAPRRRGVIGEEAPEDLERDGTVDDGMRGAVGHPRAAGPELRFDPVHLGHDGPDEGLLRGQEDQARAVLGAVPVPGLEAPVALGAI